MKIIDAHHHYWDPANNYHPWLRDDPMIPFRYGDYTAIRGRFMPAEYDQVSQGWSVAATITMEGEWDPADPLGEARWIQQMANESGRPAAHAAQAWLDRDDLPATLEGLAALPVVRSIRHKPGAKAGPGQGTGSMSEASYVQGFRQLAAAGLHFELQTPWWHLPELTGMAAQSPDTLIIINHTGLPADRSADALAGWESAMKQVAQLEQVRVKISGLGQPGLPYSADNNRAIILKTIDIFGPSRCMFASNFPVDGLCGTFDDIYQCFEQVTADFSETERISLFAGTAAQTYKIPFAN